MQKLTSLPPLKQLSFLLSIALASLTFSTTFAAFPQQCGNGTGKDPCAQTTQSSAVVGSTSSSGQTSSSVGNPISVITGDKFQLETDYSSSGGVASLRFKRFYSSLNTVRDSGLGQGWRHSFDLALTAKADGSVLQIRQSDGRRVIFNRVSVHSKTYRGVAPQDGIVTRLGDTVQWSLSDGRVMIFEHGRPIKIAYPGGREFTLVYEKGKTRYASDAHLLKVTDNQGRSLMFTYTAGNNSAMADFLTESDKAVALSGHLASVELPDGGKIHYQYDNEHNLSQVTYPDKTSRVYHYENLEFPNHLTGITDRTGKRFATYAYDDEGRANLSEHADGVEKVTLEYKIPAQAGKLGKTTLTNTLGQKSTYRWKFYPRISQSLLISSEGPGCSTCPAPNKQYTYNNHYQIETVTDTQTQAVTRYEYDKLGRTKKITTTPKGETEQLIARYEYNGNNNRPTLIARPSVNKDGEHLTKIQYNDDQLPIAITEKGFSSKLDNPRSNNQRKVSLEYKNGNVTKIDIIEDQKTQTTQIEYDDKNRLKKRLLPIGEELIILERDKAGRPIKVSLKQRANNKAKTYTFKYDWEGNTTEIAEGGRKVLMEYNAKAFSIPKKTSIILPEKKAIPSGTLIAKKILETISSTAYAADPSKTTVTGVPNQSSRVTTFLEFNYVNKRVQKADSATPQSYLPASLKPDTTGTKQLQCTSVKKNCANIKEGIKYAELSTCVYNIEKCTTRSKPRSEWKRVTAQDLGIDEELLNDGSYHAEVLFNGKEYVLIFEGTADAGDWTDNLGQGGMGVTTKQYEKAMRLARLLKKKKLDFTITGHSLGGGLATAAALASGEKAVVFNAASLHPDFIKNNQLDTSKVDQLITNYTVEGEVLTTTQDGFNKPAIGSRITLEPDIDYHSGNASSVDLHSMDAVNDTLLHQQLMLGCNASPL